MGDALAMADGVDGDLRKGELYGLRKIDIALDAAGLDVMRSYTLLPKSGKPRHVPIHPQLARALRLARDHLAGEVARMAFAAPSSAGVTNTDDERRKRATKRHKS